MNHSTAAAQALVRGLVRAGVEDFVVSPGSRSAPLTYAIAVLSAAGRVRTHVRIDERDAAFTALGIARAGRHAGRARPVAVVTTSGSAVGNLHPAVMEAAHSHVPLVVLSADRPARLRGTGANQTLDAQQEALPEVVAAWDIPVPTWSEPRVFRGAGAAPGWSAAAGGLQPDPASFAEVAAEAVHTALGERWSGQCGAADPAWAARADELELESCSGDEVRLEDALPGPVQLNVQFDAPLVPEAADLTPAFVDAPSGREPEGPAALSDEDGFVPHLSEHGELRARLAEALSEGSAHPVLVAGDDLGFASVTASALAAEHGMPVFAEPSTALACHPNVVPAHARVLGETRTAELRAEITHVVVAGRPTLSRPITALLGREDVERIDLPYHLDGLRPAAGADQACGTRVQAVEREVPDSDGGAPPEAALTSGEARPLPTWLERWQQAAAGTAGTAGHGTAVPGTAAHESALDGASTLDGASAIDGASVARMLLERPGVLFAASSNTVRLLAAEQHPDHPARVLASRGLAGIDGLISTASGLALGLEDEGGTGAQVGTGEQSTAAAAVRRSAAGNSEDDASGPPVRLLVGDLATLHDLGGLFIPSGERRPRLQIIVLNDDGGAIFSGLEHSAAHLEPYFERFFTTPHGLTLAPAARALGWEAFSADCAAGTSSPGEAPHEATAPEATAQAGGSRAADALAAFLDSGEPGLFEVHLHP